MDPKKLSGVIMIVAIIVDVLWGFWETTGGGAGLLFLSA